MIIGKGGSYIKQIKDDTGAFVQISQKSQDTVLLERVVTVAGFFLFCCCFCFEIWLFLMVGWFSTMRLFSVFEKLLFGLKVDISELIKY